MDVKEYNKALKDLAYNLLDMYPTLNHDITRKIVAYADEEDHSYGIETVEQTARDVADLVEECIKTYINSH